MRIALASFAEDRKPAQALAAALGLPLKRFVFHRFPDGEGMPRLDSTAAETLVLYRSLVRPDAKLMSTLLAADAARRAGARRLVLVAPYMPYLRQDAVFKAGQPLSRDVLGGVLGRTFDRIVTVEPHLHRTHNLEPVFAPAQIDVLSAATVMAGAITPGSDLLLIGPDAESEPWVRSVAARLGADYQALTKVRGGDRSVTFSAPSGFDPAGRRVVVVDDICSSGATLRVLARLLKSSGAASIDVVVAHALLGAIDLAAMKAEGVREFASTDSCPHPTNRIALAATLARALRREVQ